jgi:hypothetical protein
LVDVLWTVIDTPGMTAVCGSVTVPWSVAVDCARAGIAVSKANAMAAAAMDRSRCMRIPPY